MCLAGVVRFHLAVISVNTQENKDIPVGVVRFHLAVISVHHNITF